MQHALHVFYSKTNSKPTSLDKGINSTHNTYAKQHSMVNIACKALNPALNKQDLLKYMK